MMKTLYLGLDVGGTKIEGVAVDMAEQVRARVLLPTDTRSGEQAVESIRRAVFTLIAEAGASVNEVIAVGIGIPGKVHDGVVSHAVNLRLTSYPLAQALMELIGAPVFIENDVRAAALGAYAWAQERKPLESMVFLSIGTGISAGVILNSKLYRGVNGMAGEVGHAIIEVDGERCKCGITGCLETIAAGPAIARQALRIAERDVVCTQGINGPAIDEALLPANGSINAAQVFKSAELGDPAARMVVERVGKFVSRAVYNLMMAYDVELIALGGGVSLAGDAFFHPIQVEMAKLCAGSALANEMLDGGEKVILLPPDICPPWRGMIALAKGKGI